MTSEADGLMVTTIIEALMDYSRQLIMDERTDGQDYGSAALVDGITFMKEFEIRRSELAAEVERLTRQNEALRGIIQRVVDNDIAMGRALNSGNVGEAANLLEILTDECFAEVQRAKAEADDEQS